RGRCPRPDQPAASRTTRAERERSSVAEAVKRVVTTLPAGLDRYAQLEIGPLGELAARRGFSNRRRSCLEESKNARLVIPESTGVNRFMP
ncbi:MAG TPA: hypothetical protein PL001_07370, partial [Candidatus Kryptobacter bacterium]|nr:hypothetical protein [Candidatus Kryptobacter bacterium]